MQRARCYLLGETAVVLELEPPVTLESQQRIWGLAQRLSHHEEVVDAIPGMNNITVVRTALTLFDPARKEPALLRVGDKIRFVPQKEGVC